MTICQPLQVKEFMAKFKKIPIPIGIKIVPNISDQLSDRVQIKEELSDTDSFSFNE